MKPRALITHNRLSSAPTEDEQDVIAQIEAVTAAIERLGWHTEKLPLTLDLAAGRNMITDKKPDFIFNLVESLDGSDRFIAAAPLLYEDLRIPFTGSSSTALAVTSNKCSAKTIMQSAGIPTPPWKALSADSEPDTFPCIIKSATNHASIGIDDASVVHTPSEWRAWKSRHASRSRTGLFAEAFIQGREFNLSLLQTDAGVIVLPPAEISFAAFPAGKPHIVGYAAKWDSTAFEYHNTPRIFPDAPEDTPLLQQLTRTARACWDLFSLSGYARVDFRVDSHGNGLVLEVNANPCLSPDAGFVAACKRRGIEFDAVVQHIVEAAFVPVWGVGARHGVPLLPKPI